MNARMTDDEIRLRALYVFYQCEAMVTEAMAQLQPLVPRETEMSAERVLRRELGLLFRYWATHCIWGRLEARQEEAKRLNISILRLFIDAFKLPRDGSGLKYAELPTVNDMANELSQRLRHALGGMPQPLDVILHASVRQWEDRIGRDVGDALALPFDAVQAAVKRMAGS